MLEELKIYPKLKEKILKDESLLRLAKRIYRKTRSSKSVESYVKSVLFFCRFLNVEKPMDILKRKTNYEKVLNDWIDEMVANDLSSNTISLYYAGVKKWLEVNLSKTEWLNIDWRRIELPATWKMEQDKIPLKEHLRILLDHADERGKMLITLGVSSGLRIGTITQLKLKNLKTYSNGEIKPITSFLKEKIPENTLGIIIVTPEITKERTRKYLTFCTPECLKYILTYLHKRLKNGETLTSESPLIRSTKSEDGFYILADSVAKIWRNLLKTTGLERKARKWNLYRFHTLRKYFNTWCKLSGVQSDIVEFWLGHTQGVKTVYNMFGDIENPAVISRLAEEYGKCIDALTIRIGIEKVKELEKKLEEEIKLREEKIKQLEEELLKIRELVQKAMKPSYTW